MTESPAEIRERVSPDEESYSVVVFDTWKTHDIKKYVYKIAEIDDLSDIPSRPFSKGEELTVYDQDGNIVRDKDGPESEF